MFLAFRNGFAFDDHAVVPKVCNACSQPKAIE
jgi:hypothetical protein